MTSRNILKIPTQAMFKTPTSYEMYALNTYLICSQLKSIKSICKGL